MIPESAYAASALTDFGVNDADLTQSLMILALGSLALIPAALYSIYVKYEAER